MDADWCLRSNVTPPGLCGSNPLYGGSLRLLSPVLEFGLNGPGGGGLPATVPPPKYDLQLPSKAWASTLSHGPSHFGTEAIGAIDPARAKERSGGGGAAAAIRRFRSDAVEETTLPHRRYSELGLGFRRPFSLIPRRIGVPSMPPRTRRVTMPLPACSVVVLLMFCCCSVVVSSCSWVRVPSRSHPRFHGVQVQPDTSHHSRSHTTNFDHAVLRG